MLINMFCKWYRKDQTILLVCGTMFSKADPKCTAYLFNVKIDLEGRTQSRSRLPRHFGISVWYRDRHLKQAARRERRA